jgi:hypothetical protein
MKMKMKKQKGEGEYNLYLPRTSFVTSFEGSPLVSLAMHETANGGGCVPDKTCR